MESDSVELKTMSVDSKTSSTLLLPPTFERTNEFLIHYLSRNFSVNVFLRLMAIIWVDDSVTTLVNVLQCTWNVIIMFGLCCMLGLGFFWFVVVPVVYVNTPAFNAFFIMMGFTLFLQVLTLFGAFYEIRQRLFMRTSKNDILFTSSSLNVSYLVLAVSVLIGVVPLMLTFLVKGMLRDVYGLVFLGEVSICLVLTGTMYFIATDCKVALVLLDQLIEQQSLHLLTFEQFNLVRDEVKLREQSAFWINNSIIVVCLLDILTVIVCLFLNVVQHTVGAYLLTAALFFKEIPFLVVVYWYVAQVNEKSALFMSQLAVTRWNAGCEKEVERMSIYINAQGAPIAYSLAGMKLKRVDLIFQLGAWVLAFFVSILKSYVASAFN